LSTTADHAGQRSLAERLGVQPGMVVHELGYDDDVDEELRRSVVERSGGELVAEASDEIVDVVHADFADVELDRILVDAACAYMVTQPGRFDVMVASNLFGDILTDIGAAIQGGMGLAASANIAPEGTGPGLFEPVHGSAPDIAGQSRANPIGAVWAGSLMLDHLGEQEAAARVMAAIERVLAGSEARTPDLGGTASTAELGDELVRATSSQR